MMLNLYVEQHQWISMTLLLGAALLLLFWLTYHAMWRSRDRGESGAAQVRGSFISKVTGFVPWVLILLALTCLSFTIVTVLAKACRPPNW